jgi:hypothetical protein
MKNLVQTCELHEVPVSSQLEEINAMMASTHEDDVDLQQMITACDDLMSQMTAFER